MPGHSFTPEEARQAQRRGVSLKKKALKLAGESELLGFIADLSGDAKDIVVEIIRAAQANPLLGIFVALVGSNVLKRGGVIDQTTANILVGVILVAFGITEAAALEQAIPGLGALFGSSSGSSVEKLLIPTPTTLTQVQAEQKGQGQTGNKTGDAMVAAALGNILPRVLAAAA